MSTKKRWRVYAYDRKTATPHLVASVLASNADEAHMLAGVSSTVMMIPFGVFGSDAVEVDDDGDDAVLRRARQRYGEDF